MTDEQRGRFHVWRGRYFDEIDLSLMTPMQTAAYKSAFQAGLQARDAEVQALREELLNYVSADEMAVGEGYGTYPNSEHRRIRALVAGEEGTNHE